MTTQDDDIIMSSDTGAVDLETPGDGKDPPPLSTSEEPGNDRATKEILQAEYSMLREEAIKRMELRQQVTVLTLLVAGTFLTVGVQPLVPKSVPMMYPILAMFLAANWKQHDSRIGMIATFIRDEVEVPGALQQRRGLNWETFRQRIHDDLSFKLERHRGLGVFATRGVFLTTQLLTFTLGAIRFGLSFFQPGFVFNPLDVREIGFYGIDPLLLIADVAAILITSRILTGTFR